MPPASPPLTPAALSAACFGSFLSVYRPFLVLLTGAARMLEIELGQQRFRIGRGPGVDLALDDPELGRAHAELRFSAQGFEIVDLGSPSGTSLNGARTLHAVLKAGDRLNMGRQRLEFALEARPRALELTPSPEGCRLERNLGAFGR